MPAETHERVGWRPFALADNGELLSPFLAQYWPDKAPPDWGAWSGATTRARCLASDHAENCACGLRATESLDELLAAVTVRRFAGSGSSILDDCGVLARIALSGTLLPGVDVPTDDPPTTLRGSEARALDRCTAQRLGGRGAERAPVRGREGGHRPSGSDATAAGTCNEGDPGDSPRDGPAVRAASSWSSPGGSSPARHPTYRARRPVSPRRATCRAPAVTPAPAAVLLWIAWAVWDP